MTGFKQQQQKLLRTICISLLLFVISMVGITVYSLYSLRTDAIKNGWIVADMHAHNLENYLTQDLSLLELLSANIMTSDRQQLEDTKDIKHLLETTLHHSPLIRSISLVSPAGKILLSSNPDNEGIQIDPLTYYPNTHATEEQFGRPTPGLDFSSVSARNQQATLRSGREPYFIPVTYSITTRRGTFALLLALNPEYLLSMTEQDLPTKVGYLQVLRADGLLLFSSNHTDVPGTRLTFADKSLQSDRSKHTGRQLWHENQQNFLQSFRSSIFYPLFITANLSEAKVLGNWQTECKMLLSVLLPTLLCSLILATLYFRRQSQLLKMMDKTQQLESRTRALEIEARNDPLTQLPNRSSLHAQINEALAEANLQGNQIAIAFLDLDGFKQINDSFGHDAGDFLLISLAKRIANTLRHGDILARIGGDEFVAVFRQIDTTNDITPIINRILKTVVEPVVYKHEKMRVSVSIGVASSNHRPINAHQLLTLADQAMYQAKEHGKNGWFIQTNECELVNA